MHNFNRAVLRNFILCLALLCSFKTGAAVLPDTLANQLPPKGCAAFANTVDILGSVDIGVQGEQREALKKYLALDNTLVRLGPDVDLDFSDLDSDWFPIRFGRGVVLTSVDRFVTKDIKTPVREGRTSNSLGPVLRFGKHRGANSTFFRVGCPVTDAESDALRMADFVRISGFRLYGPTFEDQADSDRGIHIDRCVNVEILNMEIAGWGGGCD